MAVTKISNSSLKNLNKYDSFLAGNAAYIPSYFDSIATVNGNGSSDTVTISSIPSTYTHLQLRYISRCALNDSSYSSVYIRINGDTGSNYSNHAIYTMGSTASIGTGGGSSNPYTILVTTPNNTNGTTAYSTGILDINDYANTNKYKTSRLAFGWDTGGGAYPGRIQHNSFLWQNTAAVTSISIQAADGPWTANSQFALYGIKGV